MIWLEILLHRFAQVLSNSVRGYYVKNPLGAKAHIFLRHCQVLVRRVAWSAGSGQEASSIAKDLINSKDPKHTLFCRKAAFVAIYALIQE